MTFVRAFISIELPKNIIKEIDKIQKQLPEFKGKKTESENLHLTLKFLGNIDEDILNEVKRRLRDIKLKKFLVEISDLGVFDNRKSRKYEQQIIIWIKLTNCGALQKEIDEMLSGFFEKERRFMGHITIGRVKSMKNKKNFLKELKKIKISSGLEFEVKNFKLKKSILSSKGPKYETIEEYSLV